MYTSLFNLAYIDPGSGSLIIQVLIAILVGVGVAFRNVRMAVVSVILKLFGKNIRRKNRDRKRGRYFVSFLPQKNCLKKRFWRYGTDETNPHNNKRYSFSGYIIWIYCRVNYVLFFLIIQTKRRNKNLS